MSTPAHITLSRLDRRLHGLRWHVNPLTHTRDAATQGRRRDEFMRHARRHLAEAASALEGKP